MQSLPGHSSFRMKKNIASLEAVTRRRMVLPTLLNPREGCLISPVSVGVVLLNPRELLRLKSTVGLQTMRVGETERTLRGCFTWKKG